MANTLTTAVHADPHTLNGLTCLELEVIADVLDAGGLTEQAATLRYAHSTGDDEPTDLHRGFPEP